MERLILSGKTVIENNEITRFCFRNANKLDGTIAMIQALGMYMDSKHYHNEIIVI